MVAGGGGLRELLTRSACAKGAVMAVPSDLRCDNCKGDPSSLRLIVTETVWYLLDVTDNGLYPHQPEADPEPTLQLACVDCGHQSALRPEVRALLRLE